MSKLMQVRPTTAMSTWCPSLIEQASQADHGYMVPESDLLDTLAGRCFFPEQVDS
jgi:hypothetical protein